MESNNSTILKDEERTVCEVWTRVMGYYRPTSAFNKGKQTECAERVFFTEKCAMSEGKDKISYKDAA